MKIKSVRAKRFRRFADLSIPDLPPAKLVVLAGPNGSGKSSLFDAFAVWKQAHSTGLNWDPKYYQRDDGASDWNDRVQLEFHGTPDPQKAIYVRSAYRNDPDFQLNSLSAQGDPKAEVRFHKMIETDSVVSVNYQRLASDAVEDIFAREAASTTVGQFREKVIGEIRNSVKRLFPDLTLNTLGSPLQEGTFRFDKGAQKGFAYKNLSGGEKAAFDLILDLVVKRRVFDDTVYVIDEPEAHMNTRLQGALLEELVGLIPDGSQLWVSTHSIGMMRRAREMYVAKPDDVVFLDFGNQDFDLPVVLQPVRPTRDFWEGVLKIALDDLAELVGPSEVVISEGNPLGAVAGKNDEHDATCYAGIFADEFPDLSFVSAGSSKEVEGDRLRFAAVFPKIVKGIKVRRVIDRDDHAPADVERFKADGISVLRRRHLEAYLYDEEVLQALYEKQGRMADFPDGQAKRAKAIADSIGRGNPADDVKSAAPTIYTELKRHLGLTGCGNDQMAFARTILVPLMRPDMRVYRELREDIFGA